jgi:PadR family transcriptional regulator PadR
LRYLAARGTLRTVVVTADVLSQLRRGALEYCVLGLLSREERYGFDLVRSLGAMDGMVTGEGTLYPLLSRLQKDGRVATTWRDSDSGGPPRKYYAITSKGRRALEDFAAEWTRFRDTVDTIVIEATP